jgi:hypothetical protein
MTKPPKLDSILLWVIDSPGTSEEIAVRVKKALETMGFKVLIRSPGPADLGC